MKFWAKSVLCNHSGHRQGKVVSVCGMCVAVQQPAALFLVLSPLRKQEADLSLSLCDSPFICPFLSVPSSFFSSFFSPCVPLWIRTLYLKSDRPLGSQSTSLILKGKTGCCVSCFIQDKCDIVSREVEPAASYLFSTLLYSWHSCFSHWASPGKLSEIVSYS